jgi:hypothetical protein
VRRIGLVLALGGLLALGGGAFAGTTTTWSRVTDTGARNIDQVGLARTQDGVLHVAWRRMVGADESIRHATIAPSGSVGAAISAVTGIRGVSDPDLVLAGDGGLQVFYGAVTPSPSGIRMSQAAAAGSSWTPPAKVSSESAAGSPGAAVNSSGTPIFAWASGTSSWFHVGTNPGQPDVFLGPSPQCCYYELEVATEGNRALVAYHSNVSGQPGLFVRQIQPSLGSPQLAPGSVTGGSLLNPDHRMPLVARQGGGIFLAYCGGYPRCTRVLLWRVGGRVLTVARGADVEDVNLARGPNGRLWLMWHDSGHLAATRTNPAATKAGAIVRLSPPPGTSSLWDVFGEGSLGRLDLLAHVTARGGLATWHRHVLPGLTLKCVAKRTGATCRVTDAGAPVAGAKVRAGGKTATTAGSGMASLTLASGGYAVTATKAGYSPAKATVRVR